MQFMVRSRLIQFWTEYSHVVIVVLVYKSTERFW